MAYDLSRLHIMLVDDNQHARRLMREILSGLGIRQVHAYDSVENAIHEINQHQFDLALVDWFMEPMDGLQLVRWIRTAKESPDPFLPIIMVSAHSEMNRVETARDAGVSEYLVKPVSAKGVYDKITRLIEDPRSFVRSGDFSGPNRRRQHRPDKAELARRATDQSEGLEETDAEDQPAKAPVEAPVEAAPAANTEVNTETQTETSGATEEKSELAKDNASG